jgi:hypothetical protein
VATVDAIRFAVGDAQGLQAGIWRVWANRKGDVYVAPRGPAGRFKTSLHRSGRWRFGYTKEFASEILPGGADKAPVQWRRPPEIEPGRTIALDIVVPVSEVVTPPQPGSDHRSIIWYPAPRLGICLVFRLELLAWDRVPDGGDGIGPLHAGAEALWITKLERAETEPERAEWERSRRILTRDVVSAFPAAGCLGVRGVVIGVYGDGQTHYLVDLVLPKPAEALAFT